MRNGLLVSVGQPFQLLLYLFHLDLVGIFVTCNFGVVAVTILVKVILGDHGLVADVFDEERRDHGHFVIQVGWRGVELCRAMERGVDRGCKSMGLLTATCAREAQGRP